MRERSSVCSAKFLHNIFGLKALLLVCLSILLSVIKKAYIHVFYCVAANVEIKIE